MADNIQATPRNYLGGLLSDAYKWMQSPERTQQMQGFAGLLGTTGVPQTIERMAYGEPLTNIGRANVPLLKPETADALMTVAPMVGPALRGAGRLAGSAVNEAMVYGRGPLAGITPQPMRMDVWHGSPHGPFTKFDSSKIGSGEGAQAYSYGHYLGEARGTGEGYRDTLAYKAFDLQPEAQKLGLNLSAGTRGEFIRQTRADKPPEVLARQLQNANIAARDLPQDKLAELFRSYKEKGGGYLYKVDLPDEAIAKMIDWEKPLSQQPQNVQDALKGIESNLPEIPDFNLRKWMDADPLASTWYNTVVRDLGVEPQQLSGLLQQRGVVGTRYLDNISSNKKQNWTVNIPEFGGYDFSSRQEADAFIKSNPQYKTELIEPEKTTSNFVVFPQNEDLLTIKEINDQPVQGLLGR
jgi:hypothetical protein